MKNLYTLFLIFLFLISCAPQNGNTKKNKEIAMATQRLGEEHYNAGQYTAALKNLIEAYNTIPNSPKINNSLGLVYLAKKRYDLAQTHFEKALNLKPDYIHAKNNLGAAYLKQKKWDLAIKCFEEVSENLLYANPEIPFSNLGWAYFHQKMFKKSKKYFRKSLDIRPNFLVAIHGLAMIYIETGHPDQAIDFIHKTLREKPRAAILHSDLAKAYEATKDFNKAKRSWNVVIKLEPAGSPLAKEAQKRLFELN